MTAGGPSLGKAAVGRRDREHTHTRLDFLRTQQHSCGVSTGLASIASRRCAREFIEREVLAGLPDWAPVLNPILMALLVPPRPLGWIWVSDVLHHQRLRSFANGGRKCPILAKPSFSPLKAAASNAAFGEQESLVHRS